MNSLLKTRDAQRPWRGLPDHRALDSSDLSWFKKPFSWWTHGKPVEFSRLRDAMRQVYNDCSHSPMGPSLMLMPDDVVVSLGGDPDDYESHQGLRVVRAEDDVKKKPKKY